MQTNQTAEKRQHIRFPSNRPVVLIINQQNIYATMTDFSRRGIGFMASIDAPLKSMVEVHFDIPAGKGSSELHPFQFKAEVKHCIHHNHENHIGVQIDIPSQDYVRIFDELTAA